MLTDVDGCEYYSLKFVVQATVSVMWRLQQSTHSGKENKKQVLYLVDSIIAFDMLHVHVTATFYLSHTHYM